MVAVETDFLDIVVPACFAAAGVSFGPVAPDGSYRFTVVRNDSYFVSTTLPVTSIGTPEEGILSMPPLTLASGTNSFGADTMMDVNFLATPGTVMLSGTVTGNGAGVEGVDVDVFCTPVTGVPNSSFIASTTTDGSGNYSFAVLPGTCDVEFRTMPPDPPGGGFVVSEDRD